MKGQLQNFGTLVVARMPLWYVVFGDRFEIYDVCISVWIRVIARQSLTAESEYKAHVPSEVEETSFV